MEQRAYRKIKAKTIYLAITRKLPELLCRKEYVASYDQTTMA
jgi:hypothetical protein